MKRLNIELSEKHHAAIERVAKEAHNSKKRIAELYVMRGLEAQPAEVADLVEALRDMIEIAECDESWNDPANESDAYAVLRVARAALAPFAEVE